MNLSHLAASAPATRSTDLARGQATKADGENCRKSYMAEVGRALRRVDPCYFCECGERDRTNPEKAE